MEQIKIPDLSKLTVPELNNYFCELIGIKQVLGFIHNLDTDEIKYYASKKGLNKPPKGWTNIKTVMLPTGKSYPDLITCPANFLKLLNIQWDVLGAIGSDTYHNVSNEPFEVVYIRNRITSIKMCLGYGGGEMLDVYIQAVKKAHFDYVEIVRMGDDDVIS